MRSQQPYSIKKPPLLIERFLHWSLPKELKEPVLGDLSEAHFNLIIQGKESFATYWYCRQAIKTSLQFLWKTKRGLMMFILSILLFAGMIFMAMLLGAEPSAYFDIPSFLLTVPPAVLFAIGATSTDTAKMAFGLLLNDIEELTEKDYKAAYQFFNVMGTSSLLLGFVSTVIGWVAIGSNMEPENYSKVFGYAFAVSILTLMYGLVVKIVCYVAQQKIQFKHQQLN